LQKELRSEIYTSLARVNSRCHKGGQIWASSDRPMILRTSGRVILTRSDLSKMFV